MLAVDPEDCPRQAADAQKQQGRELAMLEGTAALARFRQSPKPEWNARGLAAFQRAMALADPNSATNQRHWWEIDLTYLFLRGLVLLGLAWDVQLPKPAAEKSA